MTALLYLGIPKLWQVLHVDGLVIGAPVECLNFQATT